MEELKNEPKGIISEEALDQVAAGMDIDRATLRKVAKIAGIVVVSGAALAGAGIGGKALIDRCRNKKQLDDTTESNDEFNTPYTENVVKDMMDGFNSGQAGD